MQQIWDLLQREPINSFENGHCIWQVVTYWGRVTHICVVNLTIIGSDNGLAPCRGQTIIWTNIGILLIGPLGTYLLNFNRNSIIFVHENALKSAVCEMAAVINGKCSLSYLTHLLLSGVYSATTLSLLPTVLMLWSVLLRDSNCTHLQTSTPWNKLSTTIISFQLSYPTRTALY